MESVFCLDRRFNRTVGTTTSPNLAYMICWVGGGKLIPQIMIVGPPLRGPSAGESFRRTGTIWFELCCGSSSTDTGWEFASSSDSKTRADDGFDLRRKVCCCADLCFVLTTNSYGRREWATKCPDSSCSLTMSLQPISESIKHKVSSEIYLYIPSWCFE